MPCFPLKSIELRLLLTESVRLHIPQDTLETRGIKATPLLRSDSPYRWMESYPFSWSPIVRRIADLPGTLPLLQREGSTRWFI